MSPTSSELPDEVRASVIDPRLLAILICPISRGPLRLDVERQELVSVQARLAFPIREGIPILLAEEARELSDNDLSHG